MAWLCGLGASSATDEPGNLRLITLDPGHFHAALFQKEMLPGVSHCVQVYAPFGPDLLAHLDRINDFNTRKENPTAWQTTIHTGREFLERMLAERPGNVVVISGNNRGKIERIGGCVQAGLHVLADKPWILDPGELPKLAAALEAAERSGIVAYDAMTQRFEFTRMLQRELVNDRAVFGEPRRGTVREPAVIMESVHYLLKEVAGTPLQRPAWFFDLRQQGECLADVGPHLADLVQWTLFPDEALDYRRDIQVLQASRRPLFLSRTRFQRVTGLDDFPKFLHDALENGHIEYFADNTVSYTLRRIHVRLDARWEFEAPPGGKDTEPAIYRGTVSRVAVRQGRAEQFRPEVYVVPNRPEQQAAVRAALERRIEKLRATWPGLKVREQAGQFNVFIPDGLRAGHEAHFALLTQRFLEYVRQPRTVPAWERPNMLAKYFVTTEGIRLARQTANPASRKRTTHENDLAQPY